MKKKYILYLNIAVLLFGFAGLFGKWIQLPSLGITFGRVLVSSVSLGIYMLLTKQSFAVDSRRDLLLLILGGAVLSLHWWAVFESIRISSVAIGCITFSTFPLFITFAEPAFFHEKLKWKNVVLALIIMIGLIITVPEFSLDNAAFRGILIGMISPVAYTALTIINKSFSTKYTGTKNLFLRTRRSRTVSAAVCPRSSNPSYLERHLSSDCLWNAYNSVCPHALYQLSQGGSCQTRRRMFINGNRIWDPVRTALPRRSALRAGSDRRCCNS